MKFKRIDWCPGCGWRRLVLEDDSAQPETADDWQRVGVALHEDQAAHPCCNPRCRGEWGTGCWHCHHPSYAPKRSVLRRLTMTAAMDERRRAREANRSAPRGTHYGLDALSEKADRSERDRVRMPSLPRWQRGEWRHIRQRTEGRR